MIPIKARAPSAKHIALREELLALMKSKMATMDATEILAIVSHLVGQLIALQDQRKVTSAMALKLVSDNIEAGNAEALAGVLSAGGIPS